MSTDGKCERLLLSSVHLFHPGLLPGLQSPSETDRQVSTERTNISVLGRQTGVMLCFTYFINGPTLTGQCIILFPLG